FGWIQENFEIANGVIYVPNENQEAPTGVPGLFAYTLDGAPVSMTTIPNNGFLGVAVSGNDIYLSGFSGIAEYSTDGTLINSSLITGLDLPNTMLLVPTPEPAASVMLAIGAAGLFVAGIRRRRHARP
ncbi:MAG TPA: PEP-CTERM sorting domain-containing protein, partial [Pirellulales bacterium]|nr:PEP-CTERM sorting domain-containing protein [Pirellulales bacterium]